MRVVRGLLLALGLTALAVGSARSGELAGRVLWSEGPRVYLLARDSGSVAPAARVTFFEKRRLIAGGTVSSVTDGRLATVILDRGALEVRRLGRLRMEVEPPAAPPAVDTTRLTTLRVGVPAGTRDNLAVPCVGATLDLSHLEGRYRFEPLDDGGARGVRLAAAEIPETLLVRRFRDAADQEIAFERGEIDVAVFWPGEPSARARRNARGEWLLADRPGGALTLVTGIRGSRLAGTADPDVGAPIALDARLRRMNEELFGGDLLPIEEVDPTIPPADSTWALLANRGFSVEESIPGHRAIEHFLNGGATLFVRDKLGPLRLRFEDRSSSPAGRVSAPGSPLFLFRCPILCSPGTASLVHALHPEALANLVRCTPATIRR